MLYAAITGVPVEVVSGLLERGVEECFDLGRRVIEQHSPEAATLAMHVSLPYIHAAQEEP